MNRTMVAFGLAAMLGSQAFAQETQPAQREGAGASATAQEKGQRFAARLNGSYRVVSGRSRGQEIPKERLDTRVTIQGNVMTVYDRDEKELYVVEFRPAPRGDGQGQGGAREKGESTGEAKTNQDQSQAREPGKGQGMGRRILLKTVRSTRPGSEDTEARGLIKVEGETVTLVYDYSAKGEFPEGFETQGESQNLFVLRKDAPGDAETSKSEPTRKEQP